jgi:hemerythrin-like domain-containing protein
MGQKSCRGLPEKSILDLQMALFRALLHSTAGTPLCWRADWGANKGQTMSELTTSKESGVRDRDITGRGVRDGGTARGRDIARDFVRIHSVITYALKVSMERSESYAQEGYPDATTRKGFTSYVRCLSALLQAHHTTEDDLAFPYFWEKLPDLPVERLIGQHQQMDPLLDQIRAELQALTDASTASQSLVRLNRALESMLDLWLEHVEIEEHHLSSERIRAALDDKERAMIRDRFVAYSRLQQRRAAPLSLLIPFILYNLSCEDRPALAPRMARFVTRVLIPHVWKHRWRPMVPFLREPPQP